MELKELVKFLDEYLDIRGIKDTSWNGLQFEGKNEVKKIMFAVDGGKETYKRAVEEEVDFLIVHHGHFWSGSDPSIAGWKKEQLDILMNANISLYAAHLPLDRHKDVGNNAQLIKILGGNIVDEFEVRDGKNIGWIGEFDKSIPITQIETKLNFELSTKCKVLNNGVSDITRIAVCSGGGGYGSFFLAMETDIDLYLTGDSIEAYHVARDARFNVIFAGHHATEIVGVRALGDVVKGKFDVETVFIDIPTGF